LVFEFQRDSAWVADDEKQPACDSHAINEIQNDIARIEGTWVFIIIEIIVCVACRDIAHFTNKMCATRGALHIVVATDVASLWDAMFYARK